MYSVLLNHLKALSKSFQRRASVPPVPPTVRAAPVRARTVPAESPATLQVRAWDPADRTLRSESGESDSLRVRRRDPEIWRLEQTRQVGPTHTMICRG